MIASLLLLAQASQLPPCNEEAAERGVQQDMNICAAHEFDRADAALNAQWRITRDLMKARDAESDFPDWDKRPGYFDQLLAAQRAWIAYRDAHCASEGFEARNGSLEPLLVSTCKTHLTEQRTQQLRSLAETY